MKFGTVVFVSFEIVSGTSHPFVPFVPSEDPCFRLCREYSAERKGHGYDLCESLGSRCIDRGDTEVCLNLYWSTTEEGIAGYFLSNNDDELTIEERERPVSCFDALQDVMEDFESFHQGVLRFANRDPSAPIVLFAEDPGNFFDHLDQYREQTANNNLRFSTFEHVFGVLGYSRSFRPGVVDRLPHRG